GLVGTVEPILASDQRARVIVVVAEDVPRFDGIREQPCRALETWQCLLLPTNAVAVGERLEQQYVVPAETPAVYLQTMKDAGNLLVVCRAGHRNSRPQCGQQRIPIRRRHERRVELKGAPQLVDRALP